MDNNNPNNHPNSNSILAKISQRLVSLSRQLANYSQKTIDLIKQHKKKVIFFSLVVLTSSVLIYKLQNSIIYQPYFGLEKSPRFNQRGYRNPGQQNLIYQDLQIKSEDNIKIRGWLIKNGYKNEQEIHYLPKKKSKRLVVYFHQNAGNIGTRIDFLREFSRKTSSDMMLIAYRGYSDSQGEPTQRGLKIDARAIMKQAIRIAQEKNRLLKEKKQLQKKQMKQQNQKEEEEEKYQLYIFGRSLGGAVGIYSASQFSESLSGIIVQNTFTSIPNVAKKILPIFLRPLTYFVKIRNNWNSKQLIKKIHCPILFIKSEKDELIPKSQMDELQQQAQKNQITNWQYLIKDGTHNYSWTINPVQYFDQLNAFFSHTQENKKKEIV